MRWGGGTNSLLEVFHTFTHTWHEALAEPQWLGLRPLALWVVSSMETPEESAGDASVGRKGPHIAFQHANNDRMRGNVRNMIMHLVPVVRESPVGG